MRYTWQCRVCDTSVIVNRTVSEIDLEPFDDEGPCMCNRTAEPKWVRLVTSTATFIRGAGWNHHKGEK